MNHKCRPSIHLAARNGDMTVVKGASKSDCSARDDMGMTPLHWAALTGNHEMLAILVKKGGSLSKEDNFGNTPLHCAAIGGNSDCVSFLIRNNANIWALDNDFHNAAQLSEICNQGSAGILLDQAAAAQTLKHSRQMNKRKSEAQKRTRRRLGSVSRNKMMESDRLRNFGIESQNPLIPIASQINQKSTQSMPSYTFEPHFPAFHSTPHPILLPPRGASPSIQDHSPLSFHPSRTSSLETGAVAKLVGRKRAQDTPRLPLYTGVKRAVSFTSNGPHSSRSSQLSPPLESHMSTTESLDFPSERTPSGALYNQSSPAMKLEWVRVNKSGMHPMSFNEPRALSEPDLSTFRHSNGESMSGSLAKGILHRPGLGSLVFLPNRKPSTGDPQAQQQLELMDWPLDSRKDENKHKSSGYSYWPTSNGQLTSSRPIKYVSKSLGVAAGKSALVRLSEQRQNTITTDDSPGFPVGLGIMDRRPGLPRTYHSNSTYRNGSLLSDRSSVLSGSESYHNDLKNDMETFLRAINLVEFAPLMRQEKIDLDALILCTDQDLRELKLPMGARKKILNAAIKRHQALSFPGSLRDSTI